MDDLSIVTSCTGYGQYLGDWAEAIVAQSERPGMVAIVTHGTEADRLAGESARKRLSGAGLRVKGEHSPERLDLGVARNRAVALSETAWVMHLDCDDTLMPHAVSEIAKIAPVADVVAIGYERVGDLAAGPRRRSRTYHSSQGKTAVASVTPASGVSPFRRSFWERSPYRTDMIGGWDTALWIGFAHLGARFVPSRMPLFWYRQHADSLFNVRDKTGWEKEWTGQKFNGLRRGDRGVAFIVPRMRDNGARDAVWRWLRARWEALYPEWEIVEGELPNGRWNKGEAVARAIAKCGAATLIIADADCVHSPETLREAVRLVEAGAPWVMPHTMVHRLSEAATARWLAAPPESTPEIGRDLDRNMYRGYIGGGSVVVPRATYEASGGIPRRFVGWGCEDEALGVLLNTLAGEAVRLPDPLIHLWHPSAMERRGVDYRNNRSVLDAYQRAAGNKVAMFHLVANGTLAGHDPYSNPHWRHRTQHERGIAMRDEGTRHTRGDFFMLRKLEAQQQRSSAAREAAQLVRERNTAAYKAGILARHAGRKALPGPVANKAIFTVAENKAVTMAEPEVEEVAEDVAEEMAGGLTVGFANTRALDLATLSGLRDADFAVLLPDSSRGFTVSQVRAILG